MHTSPIANLGHNMPWRENASKPYFSSNLMHLIGTLSYQGASFGGFGEYVLKQGGSKLCLFKLKDINSALFTIFFVIIKVIKGVRPRKVV